MSAPIPPGVLPEEDAEAREIAPVAETLLDYYASAAMRAMLTVGLPAGHTPRAIARDAFAMARAMVRERLANLPKVAP